MGKEIDLNRITAKNVGFDLGQEAENVSRALKINPNHRREIIETTARQIRTYESETLEDNVVSFYPCFIHSFKGETKLFSSDSPREEFLIESQIDPLERDGIVSRGFKVLQDKMGEANGKRLFLWVSPKGSAGTRGIYKDINYGYHQVYLGSIDGQRTEAYALKSDIKEEILAQWVNQISHGEVDLKGDNPQDFLLNPVVTSSSQEDALLFALLKLKQALSQNQQTKFYKNIDIDNLPQMIRDKKIKQEADVERITRELEKSFSSDGYLGFEEARRAIGGQMYVLYDRYANERGEVKLTGCAGGSISINSLFEKRLEQPEVENKNIFSTEYRLKSSEKTETMKCVTCPFCSETVDAIVTQSKIICPKCNKSADKK